MRTSCLRPLIMAFGFALPLLCAAAPAQPPHAGQAPSLRAAVENAWARSPVVQTQDARSDESAAARDLAGSWIATTPILGLSQRSDRWTDRRGERESEISLAASVWLPRQKSAREQLAASSGNENRALSHYARLSVAGEVRDRMWEAASARESLAEQRDHVAHLEELAADVQRRVQAGEMARSDGLLAEQEVLAARNAVFAAQNASDLALARFRVLTGYDDLPPLAPEALADAPGSHIRIEAARAGLDRAEANVTLASAARHPPPTLAVLARHERTAEIGEPSRSIGLAVQIPLGSRIRNRPAEALAATQLADAAAQAAQADAIVATDVELARRQIATAILALEAATRRAVAMREHTRLMDTAFREGERALAELLRSRALTHEAEVGVRQSRVALGHAHSRLNQALGQLP
jgi:outer membrane protein TolC